MTGSVDATVCATAQAGTEGKTMRIVAWNCNEGLKRDLPAVRALGADLAVLAEVGPVPPPDSLFDPAPSWHFVDDGVPSHGMALAGLRPVVEMRVVDFALCGMDEMVNQAAKNRFMFGGQGRVPMVVRMPIGIWDASAAQHSQSFESWFAHLPGLVVARTLADLLADVPG